MVDEAESWNRRGEGEGEHLSRQTERWRVGCVRTGDESLALFLREIKKSLWRKKGGRGSDETKSEESCHLQQD